MDLFILDTKINRDWKTDMEGYSLMTEGFMMDNGEMIKCKDMGSYIMEMDH